MLIDIIAGARPNFVKIASIIHAIKHHKKKIKYRLIHTGQHYDSAMSKVFFKELNIPIPNYNLKVGSGSHAVQTAKIMIEYEKIINKKKSNLCIVVGDVNSTIACALTAKKLQIKVAHVEAGLRSYDLSMPEEINRMATDSISDYFFCTSMEACKKLLNEGKKRKNIFFVGNTMIDTLLSNIKKLRKPKILKDFKSDRKNYYVLTLHRPNNVDKMIKLKKLIEAICHSTNHLVIFPMHPRTRKIFNKIKSQPHNLLLTEPFPYLEFNYLIKHCMGVITDSGGITEEATVLSIPCITMRENTERPETIKLGTNVLIGNDIKALPKYIKKIETNNWKVSKIPKKWDGKTGDRIIELIIKKISNDLQ